MQMKIEQKSDEEGNVLFLNKQSKRGKKEKPVWEANESKLSKANKIQREFTRIVLHTVEWKHLHIAIALCGNLLEISL